MRNLLRIFILLIAFGEIFIGCSGNIAEKKDIRIFKIVYNEYGYTQVSGIVLMNDTLYYFANDSLLMLYDKICYNGVVIKNHELKDEIENYDYNKLKSIDYSKCKGITKNEYIIRVKNSKKKEEYIIPVLFDCPDTCDYKVINIFRLIFSNYENTQNDSLIKSPGESINSEE